MSTGTSASIRILLIIAIMWHLFPSHFPSVSNIFKLIFCIDTSEVSKGTKNPLAKTCDSYTLSDTHPLSLSLSLYQTHTHTNNEKKIHHAKSSLTKGLLPVASSECVPTHTLMHAYTHTHTHACAQNFSACAIKHAKNSTLTHTTFCIWETASKVTRTKENAWRTFSWSRVPRNKSSCPINTV